MQPRHKTLLRLLWRHQRLSRWELHEQSGLTPNAVGQAADQLLSKGLIREADPEPVGGTGRPKGRPRVPLELDPSRRHVLGLALEPGRVQASRVSLTGEVLDEPVTRRVDEPQGGHGRPRLLSAARRLLTQSATRHTLLVGATVPGLIDLDRRRLLISSAVPDEADVPLQPFYDAAGALGTPLIMGNDQSAVAARWLLTHRREADEDVILVSIDDGRLGAAYLVAGRPARGCVSGAAELGHTRFPVDTPRCYCGHTGCVERIVSTEFLRHSASNRPRPSRTALNASAANTPAFNAAAISAAAPSAGGRADLTLADLTRDYLSDVAGPLDAVFAHLTHALANPVNLLRPHRLVLTGPLITPGPFARQLTNAVRALLLGQLATRVAIDVWPTPLPSAFAETSAWLALADLYHDGWAAEPVSPVHGESLG